MAVDIFGRTAPADPARYTAENVTLTFSDAPAYVQNVQFSYAQRINRMFDLGNPNSMLWVIGRPEGNLSLSHLITGTDAMKKIMDTYGNACVDTSKNVITLTLPDGKCGNAANAKLGMAYTFNSPVLASIGASMSVGDYMVTDQMQFMFAWLGTA